MKKFLFLFMVPPCMFASVGVVRAWFLLPLDFTRSGVLFPFSVGLGAGLVVFALLCKFRLLYVFGHELTHWLLAKLFRRRTGRFRVGLHGGSVEIENPNLWIALGPYFIPLYSLLWSGIYFAVRQVQPLLAREYVGFAVGGIGLTYAYHLWMTGFALRREQTDLQEYGVFFSFSLIIMLNLGLVFLASLAVTGEWRLGFAGLWAIWREQAGQLL